MLSLRHMSSIPPPAPAGRCVKASAAKHTEEGTAVSSGRGLFHHTEHHLPELIVFDLVGPIDQA